MRSHLDDQRFLVKHARERQSAEKALRKKGKVTNMTNFTPELIEKAKAAKSAEEILALAKAEGVEMTAEEAETCFGQLNPKSGELDDDDLDAVAGGACQKTEQTRAATAAVKGKPCPHCGRVAGWSIYDRDRDKTYFYCVKCKRGIKTLASENNSILHKVNYYYYPDTP